MRTIIFCILLGCFTANAQKTVQYETGQESPKANLEDMAWLTGHWKGEALGGMVEEIWSPASGDSMMFVFRLVNDGKVSFYEIGHILEKEGTLFLQLKHFNGDLHGWETKEETVDFRLVRWEENVAYFEGFTIERIDPDHITMHVLVGKQEEARELTFAYSRTAG